MADTKISGLSAVTDVLSTDEFVLARAGTTKKIDAVDLAVGIGAGGSELAFAEVTSPVTITSSDLTNPTTVVSLGAVTYEAVPTVLTFFAPNVNWVATDQAVIFVLCDGTTELCRWGDFRGDANEGLAVKLDYRFTPSAGSHTYLVGGYRGTSNVVVEAGTGSGGSGLYAPIQMRAVIA